MNKTGIASQGEKPKQTEGVRTGRNRPSGNNALSARGV
jgi:hypothetical protein